MPGPTQSADSLTNTIIDAVLKILRQQRDDKQQQSLSDTYDFNPQIFQYGTHYVAGPIYFKNAFLTIPKVTFGAIAQRAIEDTSIANHPLAQGFTPAVIYPYVYGFQQSAKQIDAFYLGLFAMTSIPPSASTYTVCWRADGKGSSYPQQRIDEAWNTAYNKNEPAYNMQATGVSE